MAATTTPPATMLSKKFLSDGLIPAADSAASATSGITMDAVRAAAVNPVMAFSFKEALTPPNLVADDDVVTDFDGIFFTGNGLMKASENCLLCCVAVGICIAIEETDAIFVFLFFFCNCNKKNYGFDNKMEKGSEKEVGLIKLDQERF